MTWMKSLFLLALFLFSPPASAISESPIGNPNAPKGGTFIVGFPGYPKHILFYLGFDEFSAGINAATFDSLLDQHPDTYDFIPLLAESWTISPDKKLFTFKLNKAARFSDGKPVTSADVKFTWDTILNPKNKTVPMQSVYHSFTSCEVIDPQTIKFTAKTVHFKNLEKLAGLIVLPKHFYAQGDFNKAFHSKLLGSGPYVLESLKTNERIILKRNPQYWAAGLFQNIGRYNFDKIIYRSVPDYTVQHEMFKKGELDYFYFLSSKMWATETSEGPYAKNYITKIKAENLAPAGTQGIVWNLRRPLFQDVKVRTALSHLMNRELWIKELFYNNYVPATGPVAVSSDFHSPNNKPVPYDPKSAQKLLAEAGWKPGPDGFLQKNGMRFEFELLTDSKGSERYLTRYQDDLKKAGIKMSIRVTDWATSIKLVDDWQFDAKEQSRGRDIDPGDFAVAWGSAEADKKGSANSPGYKNPEVDKLAAEIDLSFDKKKRIELVRKLDEIIGRDQPLSFAWEPTFFRIAHWNKFSYPDGKPYRRYSTWLSSYHFWWADSAREAKLKKAVAAKTPFTE